MRKYSVSKVQDVGKPIEVVWITLVKDEWETDEEFWEACKMAFPDSEFRMVSEGYEVTLFKNISWDEVDKFKRSKR